MVDTRGLFEKALVDKVMAVTDISTIVVQRPDEVEEAVYRNGTLTEAIDLGTSMALEESFVQCVPRENADWDCGEFIWKRAEGSQSLVPGGGVEVLGEYVERRHFLIGP